MKAEEILHSKYFSDQLPIPNKTGIIDAMKEYAKQKCEEQRRICAEKAWVDHSGCEEEQNARGCGATINKETILNAPEPEFD